MSGAVLVTGAARGIGLATSRRLQEDGFRVVGFDILAPEDAGPFERFHNQDLSDGDRIQAAVNATIDEFGGLHGLVNNAAVSLVGPFLEADMADLDTAYSINVRAVFAFSQIAARAMIPAGGGAIVNLASINAARGVIGTSIYSTTKGAVATLTRCLAIELAPHGIRCNAVAPAPTGTRRVFELLRPEQIDARVRRIPLGRLAEPDEIADGVAFLLSDRARFLTGVVMPIDGGYLAYGS